MLINDLILVFSKIFALYSLILTTLGTFGNVLIIIVCMDRKLRTINTFKFLAIISISDIISLYQWNLAHFTNEYIKVDFTLINVPLCRIVTFLQYTSLQYSAWLLVS